MDCKRIRQILVIVKKGLQCLASSAMIFILGFYEANFKIDMDIYMPDKNARHKVKIIVVGE